ncbi:MAG: CorA family divalent cation transporter, partial [Betaproteobacteria bacterium]
MKTTPRKRKTAKLRSAKAGMPPGSLILIGDVKIAQSRLVILDYGPGGVVETEIGDVAGLMAYRRQHERLWINLYGLHDVPLLKAIGDYCELHPLAVEDMLNTDQRPKLDDYGDTLYVALHRHYIHEGRVATDQISLAIGKDFILSVQERPSGVLEPVRQRLRADRSVLRGQGSDFLAYALLDVVVDGYFLVAETLSENGDDLEDVILDCPPPATQQRLHQL